MSVDDTEAEVARRAAARLAEGGDPRLPQQVEAVLHGADPSGPGQRYMEPATTIALASLVVSAVGVAWQIYRDLRQDRQAKVAPETLARQVRVRVELPPGLAAEQRDRVVEVVVAETIAAADQAD